MISAQLKNEKLSPIKYKEMLLKNGLRVIMHEDKLTPVVAVNLFYHVGSKNYLNRYRAVDELATGEQSSRA